MMRFAAPSGSAALLAFQQPYQAKSFDTADGGFGIIEYPNMDKTALVVSLAMTHQRKLTDEQAATQSDNPSTFLTGVIQMTINDNNTLDIVNTTMTRPSGLFCLVTSSMRSS